MLSCNCPLTNHSSQRLRSDPTKAPGLQMIVSDVIEDLRASLADVPAAAAWRVGVATYVDGPGGDIDVMYIGSFHTDLDDEFFLVPEGMGSAFELEESPLSAGQLLEMLGERVDWAGFPAYVRSALVKLPDGSLASRNRPLWGAGIHRDARLVYFYYGASGSSA